MDRFLDWFERHKYGVVGTLVLHTLVLLTLASRQLRTEPTEEEFSELRVEMAPPMTEDEFRELEQQLAEGLPAKAFEEVKATSSNITAERTVAQRLDAGTRQRIESGVEEELRALEQAEFDRLAEERRERGEEIEMPELDPSKWDKANYMEQAEEPVKVEGATAVWHDLKDRAERRIHIPAYLCTGQGQVVIRVAVDADGRVRRAEPDVARSTTSDDCMVEHALSSAREARFAPSANTDQQGAIYYLFMPQ